jgi:hypothetical protein
MKNNIFDFKRYSVKEYNEFLNQFWFDGRTFDASIFTSKVLETKRSPQVLTIIFEKNTWLKIDKRGWWCKYYDDNIQDVITSSNFYNKEKHSESCGFDDIGYVHRPSKGVCYKNFIIKGLDISRRGEKVLSAIVPHVFTYRVEKFKKYQEHNFSTHSGLSFYEKVNNQGKVLRTTIRTTGNNRETYSMSIHHEKKNKIKVNFHKNFERLDYVQYFDYKDASIDFVYNKYVTFNFDMIADPVLFEIMEGIRVFFKKNIEDTYSVLKEQDKHSSFIKQLLNSIEVMEDDRTQIQERT